MQITTTALSRPTTRCSGFRGLRLLGIGTRARSGVVARCRRPRRERKLARSRWVCHAGVQVVATTVRSAGRFGFRHRFDQAAGRVRCRRGCRCAGTVLGTLITQFPTLVALWVSAGHVHHVERGGSGGRRCVGRRSCTGRARRSGRTAAMTDPGVVGRCRAGRLPAVASARAGALVQDGAGAAGVGPGAGGDRAADSVVGAPPGRGGGAVRRARVAAAGWQRWCSVLGVAVERYRRLCAAARGILLVERDRRSKCCPSRCGA